MLKLVPSFSNLAKLKSFLNCVAALMTYQLQNLAIDSLRDYTHLISQDLVGGSSSDQNGLKRWNKTHTFIYFFKMLSTV